MSKCGCQNCQCRFPKSYWLEHAVPQFPPMIEDEQNEVCVIEGKVLNGPAVKPLEKLE